MTLVFHRSFKKMYKKAPAKIREQFDERLRLFTRQPFHPLLNNHPLTGDREGQWSINVNGDWRALYEHENMTIVVFIDLDTHSNLYQ